ncbi:MAG TPA: PAS domain-containing protein [Actinomycetota bacterium]|nr:PAS domain-containing protein [Actinomycetota bacterium]
MSEGPGLVDDLAWRALVEGVPAILYIDAVDDLSTNLYTSPQVEAILGWSPERWRADPELWVRQLHPDDRDRVLAEHRESNLTGAPFRSEYRMIARDGREVWFRDEAVLVWDEQGMPVYWRGMMLDITERKRAEEALRESLAVLRDTMRERRRLMAKLERAQDEERRRIAADIHDDPIQAMSAASVHLQALMAGEEDPARRSALGEVHAAVAEAIERLRHLLFELRPPSVEGGLAGAVAAYLERAAAMGGFRGEVQDRMDEEPAPDVSATAFRIVREAIANARKHAGPSRVTVELRSAHGGLRIRIADDGRGFDPALVGRPEPGHLGLGSMLERAELAGGWCRVETAPGRGTTVECWLPTSNHHAEP